MYFDPVLDDLYSFYSVEGREYHVLLDEEGIVIGGIGYAEFAAFDDCAELQKLYLAKEAKGNGYGIELIAFIEERMKLAGYRLSYLETHDNLEAARHIYEKSGYEEIDRPASVAHGAMNRFYIKPLV